MTSEAEAIYDALQRSRVAFPEPTPLEQIPTLMAVPAGDIARPIRAAREGRDIDRRDLHREMATLALSLLRWVSEGGDLAGALEDAAACQEEYAARLRAERGES